MITQSFAEGRHALEFLLSEGPGQRSRDNATLAINQSIVPGQILGAVNVPSLVTSSAAADAGNTGNGTFTLDVTNPVGTNAKNGRYRVVCIAVASDGGVFTVEDPDGREIGRAAVGGTFNSQIKFVIADGATDFAAGDAFSVEVGVENTDRQLKPFDPTATDGTQTPVAISLYAYATGGSATMPIAVFSREIEAVGARLTWPAGITDVQKAAAIAALAKPGIIIR